MRKTSLTVCVAAGLALASAAPIHAGVEEAQLLAADGEDFDKFGASVAIEGNTLLIGAPGDLDLPGGKSGSVYVFIRTDGVWNEVTKLRPEDGEPNDRFGISVALDGDTAVIGADFEDDNGTHAGAAYVFTGSGESWTQQAKLLAPDGDGDDHFGASVAVDDDTIVVGAEGDEAAGNLAGSAYAFVRAGSEWSVQEKFLHPSVGEADTFGASVAVEGNTAFIGAPGDDDNGLQAGAVYWYVRSIGNWTMLGKLKPDDGEQRDKFGESLALDGDTLAIGAPEIFEMGFTYVFTRVAGSWEEQAKLLPFFGSPVFFGDYVAVDGDVIVIGDDWEEGNGPQSGAAWVYHRKDDEWSELAYLVPSDNEQGDRFGPVAVVGDTIVGGARDADANGEDSGAAYVFSVDLPSQPTPAVGGFGALVLASGLIAAGGYFVRRL